MEWIANKWSSHVGNHSLSSFDSPAHFLRVMESAVLDAVQKVNEDLASMHASHFALAALQLVCVVSSFSMIISGIPDMLAVLKRRSTVGVPIIPYAAMLLDNLVGYWFAQLIGDMLGLSLRSIALGVCAFHISVLMLSSNFSLKTAAPILGAASIFAVICLAVSTFPKTDAQRSDILGLVNTVTALAFAASPLLGIRNVIAQRDASSIPFATASMLTICACSWAAYGVCLNNIWMIIPNSINAVLGAAQVALCLVFGKPRSGVPAIPVAQNTGNPAGQRQAGVGKMKGT
jgi:uncharacterized protein with PQ loop repeat